MKLPLAYYGNPILRKKCKPVEDINEEIRKLVDDMVDTLHATKGIGLAAPQVHKDLALFIVQIPLVEEDGEVDPGILRVFINPKIISYSEETYTQDEGCLSIPTIYEEVERPVRITVQAQDLSGETFELTTEDLEARCILHENDHINGKLFIDRIDPNIRKEIQPQLQEIKRKYSKR